MKILFTISILIYTLIYANDCDNLLGVKLKFKDKEDIKRVQISEFILSGKYDNTENTRVYEYTLNFNPQLKGIGKFYCLQNEEDKDFLIVALENYNEVFFLPLPIINKSANLLSKRDPSIPQIYKEFIYESLEIRDINIEDHSIVNVTDVDLQSMAQTDYNVTSSSSKIYKLESNSPLNKTQLDIKEKSLQQKDHAEGSQLASDKAAEYEIPIKTGVGTLPSDFCSRDKDREQKLSKPKCRDRINASIRTIKKPEFSPKRLLEISLSKYNEKRKKIKTLEKFISPQLSGDEDEVEDVVLCNEIRDKNVLYDRFYDNFIKYITNLNSIISYINSKELYDQLADYEDNNVSYFINEIDSARQWFDYVITLNTELLNLFDSNLKKITVERYRQPIISIIEKLRTNNDYLITMRDELNKEFDVFVTKTSNILE